MSESRSRNWPALIGVLAGLALRICGIRGVFGETSYLSILANPAGGLIFLF